MFLRGRPSTAAAILVAAVFLIVACAQASDALPHKEKVRLNDVTAITLSRTGMTTGRRSAPVPQMTCVGGPCRYAPSTVLCSNAGFDGSDVLWKCKADLEKGVKMGAVTVSCEGYDYPDDPFILKGSCGLEYTLEGQAEVERHQQHHTGHGYGEQHSRQQQYQSAHSESSGGGSSLFWLIVYAALAYILYKTCCGGNGGGGGGGGGGGAGGPPPPNYRAAAPPGGAGPGYSGGSWGSSSSSSSDCAPQPAPASSGPGFWSGMAGGSALGYMFGRNSHSGWNRSASYNSSYSPSSGGWSSSSSSSGSSAPSSMGTSSSSSFGGTRRR